MSMHKTFILRDRSVLERCCAFLHSAFSEEHPIAVTVTEADRNRTREQNSKWHRQLRTLQDEAWFKGKQWPMEFWKANMLLRFGYVDSYVDMDTGKEVLVPLSSTKIKLRDYSDLIEKTSAFASLELGLDGV